MTELLKTIALLLLMPSLVSCYSKGERHQFDDVWENCKFRLELCGTLAFNADDMKSFDHSKAAAEKCISEYDDCVTHKHEWWEFWK